MRVTRSWVASLVLFTTGCAGPQYAFEPSEPTPLTPRGFGGATFAIPAGQTKSSVRILPEGVREVHGQKVFVVRFFFENFDTAPWHLDLRNQWVRYTDQGPQVQALTPFESIGPVVDLPRKVSRVADVYFPAPEGASLGNPPAGLELGWQVLTASAPVSAVTQFDRIRREDTPDDTTKSGAKKGLRH